MKAIRVLVIVAILAVAIYAGYRLVRHFSQPRIGDTITVYYSKVDGETMVPWKVSLGPARDQRSVAFYAATQAVAGPPSDTEAIRFPAGTIVRQVDVSGSTAVVDLSHEVAAARRRQFRRDRRIQSARVVAHGNPRDSMPSKCGSKDARSRRFPEVIWSSMSRLHVRVGSALLALILAAALPHATRAQATPDLWFAGTRLILQRAQMHDDDIAVATTDPGLRRVPGAPRCDGVVRAASALHRRHGGRSPDDHADPRRSAHHRGRDHDDRHRSRHMNRVATRTSRCSPSPARSTSIRLPTRARPSCSRSSARSTCAATDARRP